MDGDEAFEALMAGNGRYVAGAPVHPRQTAARRAETAGGQHPFAVVITCADSRVPPEILFDQGIGDLFVIRVAGNITGNAVVGSVEYAAEHLGVPLVVVLGHTHCGAVNAAIVGDGTPGRIAHIVGRIAPAVDRARELPGELAGNVVRANVEIVVDEL
ncbi:MAG TPA: carbonic anhydrase, partial [Patescibacteria group bacterium]|nr:carbonic anhydrase [Patescibacteria group bacterium]